MKRLAGQSRPKKSLGQNFLSDPNYIRKVVDTVGPSPGDTIIEIGPGRGALTESLVASGANVVALELDRELIEQLRARFNGVRNVRLVEGNALEADFEELASPPSDDVRGVVSKAATPVKLVANLPYYISTPILQRLAEQRSVFELLVLMFQKEVVDRITAPPGTSDRGYLTVIAQVAFDIQKVFDVPGKAFWPVPKVMSSVVRMTPKEGDSPDGFRDLLSVAFAQKRKTIYNNLRGRFPGVSSALERSGVDGGRRAESLTLEEWHRLHAAVASQDA